MENVFYKQAKKYIEGGYSPLPICGDKNNKRFKAPLIPTSMSPSGSWAHLRENPISLKNVSSYFNQDTTGIGLICGSHGNNLEVIDIDSKNDKGAAGELIHEVYFRALKALDSRLLELCPIEKTPNGGYHIYYRCSQLEKPKHLAKEIDGSVLIETISEGKIIAVCPTPGYTKCNGVLNIPLITEEQRSMLINTAKSLTRFIPPVEPLKIPSYSNKSYSSLDNTPLNDYNRRCNFAALLCSHGWTVVKETQERIFLRRPGQTKAMQSGNIYKPLNTFVCFSSSAAPFDADKAYLPATAFCLLECNGDICKAVKLLSSQGYGEKETQYRKKLIDTSNITINEGYF